MPPPPYKIKGFGDLLKLFKNNRKGFTLAETLITLTIIGVVAALTIPTLMTQYQKHQYVVGLKKVYSNLQNAMQMIPITEGCPAGDYDCAGTFHWSVVSAEQLAKQFKTIDRATDTNNWEEIRNNANCKLASNIGGHGGYAVPCFTTADGVIIGSSNGIYIDLNGQKGPNKRGRDQFVFYAATETKNGITKGTIMPAGSKQYSTYSNNTDYYWKNAYTACTTERVKNGESWYCAGRVLEEDAMNY